MIRQPRTTRRTDHDATRTRSMLPSPACVSCKTKWTKDGKEGVDTMHDHVWDVMADGGTIEPLTVDEISTLCERLNASGDYDIEEDRHAVADRALLSGAGHCSGGVLVAFIKGSSGSVSDSQSFPRP